MPLFETVTDYEPIRLMIQTEITTDDNLRRYLEQQTRVHQRLLAEGRRYVAVVDCSMGTRISPLQRKMYAEWLQENDEALRATLEGAAFIMPSALVRGALTAIFWVARLHAPHTVHRQLDDGLRWALRLAREKDLALSPKLRREGSKVFALTPGRIA
ncbi:MAG: hypothetical protein KC457_22725 [Myxococcales bacterium]|nr:hypothetical protein [Myxococcales bacterium]